MKTSAPFLIAPALAIALLAVPMFIAGQDPPDMATYYQTYPQGFKAEGGRVEDESDKPYYADYWRRVLVAERGPLEVLEAADRYFESLAYEARPPHRDKVRVDFIHGFFQGLNNPGGSIVGGEQDASWHGFQAGQQYQREHPEKLVETMKAFGYEALTAEGVWTVGFEHSGFLPRGTPEGKEWWLLPYPEARTGLLSDRRIPDAGLAVRITGFVSPLHGNPYAGGYGHLGGYAREFYATKITVLSLPASP